ncbi:MAG: hypothetical protein UH853_03150, partial [Muribaculaceae bacterium]|nr:hypothetical protein [Muribaculaceae bacterium]
MKRKLLTMAAAVCTVAAFNTSCTVDSTTDNPFLAEYTTPFEIPPFEQISNEHYLPALKAGIDEQNK